MFEANRLTDRRHAGVRRIGTIEDADDANTDILLITAIPYLTEPWYC